MNIGCSGTFYYEVRDSDGTVVVQGSVPNIITDLGEAHIANCLSGRTEARMGWMAVGSGTGQVSTDQTLDSELGRVALDDTYGVQGDGTEDTDVGRIIFDNEIVYKATFPAGTATGTLTEFGVFNANTNGIMLNYASGFVLPKGVGQDVLIWYVLKIGRS